jgi:hypothetical protein
LITVLEYFARGFHCTLKHARKVDSRAGFAYLRDVAFEWRNVLWFGFGAAVVAGGEVEYAIIVQFGELPWATAFLALENVGDFVVRHWKADQSINGANK